MLKSIRTTISHLLVSRKVRMFAQREGCEFVALTADSVGVQGENRVVGPGAIIQFPDNMTHEEISRISTRLINETRGVTRVLVNVASR